ncbi:uncharacterized protein LOC114327226 [Diabrotica virgifera virgifera]|uniref:Uncharacterized protein LOC114327226 n=1 Tax=Diabrotica virgifera virgifera TaxID=50390 RepID=A0A6P7FDY8_DIAVI|nr:uncharacterized protein LOC114327226 [Diabrotica virgifera virgifera]
MLFFGILFLLNIFVVGFSYPHQNDEVAEDAPPLIPEDASPLIPEEVKDEIVKRKLRELMINGTISADLPSFVGNVLGLDMEMGGKLTLGGNIKIGGKSKSNNGNQVQPYPPPNNNNGNRPPNGQVVIPPNTVCQQAWQSQGKLICPSSIGHVLIPMPPVTIWPNQQPIYSVQNVGGTMVCLYTTPPGYMYTGGTWVPCPC